MNQNKPRFPIPKAINQHDLPPPPVPEPPQSRRQSANGISRREARFGGSEPGGSGFGSDDTETNMRIRFFVSVLQWSGTRHTGDRVGDTGSEIQRY